MPDGSLISPEQVAGIFRGFSEGGLEFHADMVLPYRFDYQYRPMHGHFLLVQLADENEAVLGRITSLQSEGRLTSSEGEDYGIRVAMEKREFPEDLREQYLKYRVDIRVLGVLRKRADRLVFVPSQRRLPHVGSPVAFPTDETLLHIANAAPECSGAEIGFLAMGEYVWAGAKSGADQRLRPEDWMQVFSPLAAVRFAVESLVSRRTFVFARAGFGKSNLVKMLFSELYRSTPEVSKHGRRRAPVGTVVFDRDGEYFWPDDKKHPGLCDVPHLQDRLVVFTSRQAPSPFYGSFVATGVKLDIRRMSAGTVVSIALSPDKQDQQNVRKLKGLSAENWSRLVDLIYRHKNDADLDEVKTIISLDPSASDAEALAARSNMTTIVNMMHDPGSRMMDALLIALRAGMLCVVDLSQLSSETALVISGLILQKIFDHNQDEFTKKNAETIPVIAVLEEAQSVLGGATRLSNAPYITWVKEGRKYDLGAVMITQQPGSIPEELLSQGDNWFVFHLLSAGDLRAVQRANAHYSEDLLSSLLNEPIPGHCVFWSGVAGKPYPLPLRILSFEGSYAPQDPTYDRPKADTSAEDLRRGFVNPADDKGGDGASTIEGGPEGRPDSGGGDSGFVSIDEDRKAVFERAKRDPKLHNHLRRGTLNPGVVKHLLLDHINPVCSGRIGDPDGTAFQWVYPFLNEALGERKYTIERTDTGKARIVVEQEVVERFLASISESRER